MTLIVNESGGVNLTLEIGQGPPGPSTAATQAAQLAAELARDESELARDQAQFSATAAAASEANVNTQEMFAQDWASKLNTPVEGMEYSSKENAVGNAVPTGSSKNWANRTGAIVVSGEYSSKEYAIGTFVPAGSAKSWATGNQTIDGLKSARAYAADSLSGAQTATSSAATAVNAASVSVAASNIATSAASSAIATRDTTQAIYNSTVSFVQSSEIVKTYLTYQDAVTALPVLTEGAVVKVLKDEQQGNKLSYYSVDKTDPVSLDMDFMSGVYQIGSSKDQLVLIRTDIASTVYSTYAEALPNLSQLVDGVIITVLVDETRNNRKTYYRVDIAEDLTLSLNFTDGVYGSGNSTDSFAFVNQDDFKLSAVPASSTSPGTTGEIALDANFLYYCYATNLWRRVTGSAF